MNYNKEKRIFTLCVCAVFIAIIVVILHIDSRNNQAVQIAEDSGLPISPPLVTTTATTTTTAVQRTPGVENNFITIAGMEYNLNLTRLDLQNMSLRNEDIVPLQHMTNLTELTLWGNDISDITPLSGLTDLTMLRLGGNPISDISALENLVNLTELRLSDCFISDLTPLANLTNITYLTLRNNQITDWSPVAHIADVGGRPED
jgi:Leucine-rich repeat (LRR) protein